MKDTNRDTQELTEAPLNEVTVSEPAEQLDADTAKKVQNGYAVMLVAASMAGGVPASPRTHRVVNWARNFCILFAFVVPNLLLIRTVF